MIKRSRMFFLTQTVIDSHHYLNHYWHYEGFVGHTNITLDILCDLITTDSETSKMFLNHYRNFAEIWLSSF